MSEDLVKLIIDYAGCYIVCLIFALLFVISKDLIKLIINYVGCYIVCLIFAILFVIPIISLVLLKSLMESSKLMKKGIKTTPCMLNKK